MVFTCCWLICLCLSQKYPWAYMVELASDPIFLRLPTCPSPAILIPVLCVLILFAMLCFPSPAQLNRFCFVEPLLIPVPSGGSSFVKPRKAPASNLSFFLVFFQASFQSPACWITKTSFVWEAQRLTQGKANANSPHLSLSYSWLNSRSLLPLQVDSESGNHHVALLKLIPTLLTQVHTTLFCSLHIQH